MRFPFFCEIQYTFYKTINKNYLLMYQMCVPWAVIFNQCFNLCVCEQVFLKFKSVIKFVGTHSSDVNSIEKS